MYNNINGVNMKDEQIIFKVESGFKKSFKDHCGLVDMSVKIRDLIETDMAKEQKLYDAEEQAENNTRALDKMLADGEDRALTPPDDDY